MEDLTFGEQVKIILGRKGMTIKQLAELIEVKTGKKMSRQNLTQRLGRDNFQEQDMRMIAEILECPFQLSILGGEALVRPAAAKISDRHQEAPVQASVPEKNQMAAAQKEELPPAGEGETSEPEIRERETKPGISEGETMSPDERDMTIGELYDIHQQLSEMEESIKAGEPAEKAKEELEKKKSRFRPGGLFLRRKHTEEAQVENAEKEPVREAENSGESRDAGEETEMAESASVQEEKLAASPEDRIPEDEFEPVIPRDDEEEDTSAGEINPYTGREYQSNSVRMHPSRIGYVQVYDRSIHKWTDMTEWAFLGYQERKKTLLGNAYEPPIYLD